MILLGLRLDDHDSNFCLYKDGQITYLKTERVKGIKHHSYNNNWEWKIDLEKYFRISLDDIDEIAIVADPLRYNLTHALDFTTKKYPLITNCTQVEHHQAHALSSFMFDDTQYQFVIDGVGEIFQNDKNTTGTVWSVFENYKLISRNTPQFEINDAGIITRNSFGVEYENIADFLDIEASHPNDLSGKLMSLQTYGTVDNGFLEYLINGTKDIKNELSLACHPINWFRYLGSETVGKLRKLDFAATLHEYLGIQIEKLISEYANPQDKILLTGGCALNVCWNTNLKKKFPNLLLTPHCADDGLSFGALKFLLDKHNINGQVKYYQQDEAPPSVPSKTTIEKTAQLIKEGKIVGWYQANGEVGPRALGNRSILMDPSIVNGKDIINFKVKHREEYRPFGASILQEYQSEYFDIDYPNKHMLYVGKLKQKIPSISHTDNSCRFQTVDSTDEYYYKLLCEFKKLSGLPLLLNTSLNLGGKPIAGSKRDALEILYSTDMDVLVYGDELIMKEKK